MWMREDQDGNGRPDTPYDSWLDENKNGIKDPNEPLGDFEIMQMMGANTIRLYRYHLPLRYEDGEFNKRVLRDLHHNYGIRVIMGDFLGAYTVGSGATWKQGTSYRSRKHKKNMARLLKEYVLDHKDEPYVLMWVLGNENLMPGDYRGVNATPDACRQRSKRIFKVC